LLRAQQGVGLSAVALCCYWQKASLALKELKSFLATNNRSFNNASIPHAKFSASTAGKKCRLDTASAAPTTAKGMAGNHNLLDDFGDVNYYLFRLTD